MARPFSILIAMALIIGAAAAGGCTGGCYDQAGPVLTLPSTSCLTLFGGQSATDPTVCADPELGGRNDCDQTLALPARATGGSPSLFAPGARIAYPLAGPSEGVRVTASGGVRDYEIDATLGADPIVIAFAVQRE